jgi:hypothetical protein
MKKIAQAEKLPFSHKIYRDVEWNEYVIKFYLHGKFIIDSDYRTDDKQDALSTAQFQLDVYFKGGHPL